MNIVDRIFGHIELFAAVMIMLVGIPFLWVGASEFHKTQQEIATYIEAEGQVVENNFITTYNPEDSGQESGAYHPVVQFRNQDGEIQQFTDEVGSLPPDYEEGDRVEIMYNPKDPTEATIKSWKRIWFAPTLITGIGLIPVVILVAWRCWSISQKIGNRGNQTYRK